MKHLLITLVVTMTLCAADQEPKRITRTISSDDAVIIREIGAVIVPKKDKLVVEVILGNHEKETTDIQKDDLVLMANGKKLSSVKDLRSQYEAVSAGTEFKLGVKRGEELMLVKFVKKSEEELNKAGGGTMTMRIEQKEGEVVLPALGLKLGTKNDAAVIIETLPNVSGNFKTAVPKAGDIILSLNGDKVRSAEAFDEAYTDLKEGDSVTIVFSRNGKESTETFPKPKPMGRRIMMTR